METKVKGIYALLDTFLVGIFGLTMIDLMVIFTGGNYDLLTIDNFIKSILAIAGLFYFIFIKIPHNIKMNKLNREAKKLENEHQKMENKDFKDTHSD